ncbi:MAG: hypothetical protein IPP03_03870 [Dechloromonas sp.]|nr:hypothetical protein [Candidatus Dechloromonas phosphoritropha]MBP8788088.1 hypothetical protein [Azonexus sp.]
MMTASTNADLPLPATLLIRERSRRYSPHKRRMRRSASVNASSASAFNACALACSQALVAAG